MNYIIHYDVAAIFVILFTLFFLVTRKDLQRVDNKILLALTVVNLVAAIADIVAIYVQSDLPRFGIGAGVFWNELHLALHTQMGTLLLIYILALLGIRKKFNHALLTAMFLPSAVVLFIILTNPFTGWYFYYNEENIYSYGPLVSVIFGIPLLQIVLVMVLAVRYRRVLEKNMLSAMLVFFLITIAAIAIQFTHRELLIELFAEALGILGMMLAVENRDEIRTLVEALDAVQVEKDRADEANRAKSEFLANMSHEIRTPINAVLGMNEMVLRDTNAIRENDTASGREVRETLDNILLYATDIRSAGENLLSIINDILDFSKIESGKMELVEHTYRLSSILHDMNSLFLLKAAEQNLTFSVTVDETLPDGLYGDDVRVQQILTNLLSNAFKYTKEGGVSVSVDAAPDWQPAADSTAGKEDILPLRIRVSDTGIGIKKEDMAKLFEQFERIELQRNNTTEGTGLGLAITRNLVTLTGGTIDVESEYGKGSAFTVLLPQKITDNTPIGDFQKSAAAKGQSSPAATGTFRAPDARILVVDDTALNLTVIERLLKRTELQIRTAFSGAEALELTKELSFDAILMDQRMPGMDGTEAMHRIRAQADGRNHTTPVICLTANVVKGAKEHFLEEGFADYLSKPVEGVQLEAVLQRHLPPEKITPVRKKAPSETPYPSPVPVKDTPAPATANNTPDAPDTESPLPSVVDKETAAKIIDEETPLLLAEYRALTETLKPFFPDAAKDTPGEDLPELSMEELQELYEAIAEFASGYDTDSIDRLLRGTEGYAIPAAERDHFLAVKKAFRASDWERLRAELS